MKKILLTIFLILNPGWYTVWNTNGNVATGPWTTLGGCKLMEVPGISGTTCLYIQGTYRP